MRYTVFVTDRALEQMEAAYLWLAAQTELHAPMWYNGMLDAINSLEDSPLRCPRVPEEENDSGEIRQLLYGAYRILFEVHGEMVNVLDVVHGARDRRRA